MLVQNAFSQDHVLNGLRARQRLARCKVPCLDLQVLRQALLVQCQVALEFGDQIDLAQHGIGAQLHSEGVAQVHGLRALLGPARQLGAACAQHAVVLLARLACIGRHKAFDPACRFHACQLAVDLLVRGVPEVANGLVEPPRQVVARGGLFQQ